MKIIKITGNILMIIAIGYIIMFFINSDVDPYIFLTKKNLILTITLGLAVAAGILLLALAWKKNIEMLSDETVSKTDVLYIYTRANLAKYIPGNVMHYASRNLFGSEYGLSQKSMLMSSAIETLLLITVILILVLILAANSLLKTLQQMITQEIISCGLILLISAGIIATIVAVGIWVIKNRKTIPVKPLNLLKSSGYTAAFGIINAASFAIIAVSERSVAVSILVLAGYYLLAWLLGFIMPGAPGGLGIREYILLVLLLPFLQKNDILAVVVLMRLITVLGDIFAYLIGLIIYKHHR